MLPVQDHQDGRRSSHALLGMGFRRNAAAPFIELYHTLHPASQFTSQLPSQNTTALMIRDYEAVSSKLTLIAVVDYFNFLMLSVHIPCLDPRDDGDRGQDYDSDYALDSGSPGRPQCIDWLQNICEKVPVLGTALDQFRSTLQRSLAA